jgi:hypothetical protein
VHIRHLIGITADSDFLKLITWIAINFTPYLAKIDMIKAFHLGTDLLVEGKIYHQRDYVFFSRCHLSSRYCFAG